MKIFTISKWHDSQLYALSCLLALSGNLRLSQLLHDSCM